MARRKASARTDVPSLPERLRPEEAVAVLHRLLKTHPQLRSEAEQFAAKLVSTGSIEDMVRDVYDRITRIDLDALNERAGAHSWGYVEPSEAAIELLEEAVGDLVDDMKRKVELGLESAAETLCAGIIAGLYLARNTQSDGALGWAPDFPGEEAHFLVGEFLRACPPTARENAQRTLMEDVAPRAPEWAEDLKRAADQSANRS